LHATSQPVAPSCFSRMQSHLLQPEVAVTAATNFHCCCCCCCRCCLLLLPAAAACCCCRLLLPAAAGAACSCCCTSRTHCYYLHPQGHSATALLVPLSMLNLQILPQLRNSIAPTAMSEPSATPASPEKLVVHQSHPHPTSSNSQRPQPSWPHRRARGCCCIALQPCQILTQDDWGAQPANSHTHAV
jgi:hypothetical protein